MKKILIQGLIIIASFFGTWFVLNQINWMKTFNIEKYTDKTEEKLGNLFWDLFQKTEQENQNQFTKNVVDSLITNICINNGIERETIQVHILQKDEVNALALPNGHLIIFTGLIAEAENPEELSGVICHEIAHIELNHVMHKLIKEVGLSVLISMTTGNSSTEIIQETARMLASTAFDRDLEREADLKAVEYMLNANMNPEHFANFLYRMAENEPEAVSRFSWISTHPDTKERAKYIVEDADDNIASDFKPVINSTTWITFKENIATVE